MQGRIAPDRHAPDRQVPDRAAPDGSAPDTSVLYTSVPVLLRPGAAGRDQERKKSMKNGGITKPPFYSHMMRYDR